MKHTPGPWEVLQETWHGDIEVHGIYAKDGTRIVETDCGHYPPNLPDARLIAAAPELLEAAKEAKLELCRHPDLDAVDAVLLKLGQAIAKAEGTNE